MEKVYVVFEYYEHEGADVLAVFDKADTAIGYARSVGLDGDGIIVERYTMNMPIGPTSDDEVIFERDAKGERLFG